MRAGNLRYRISANQNETDILGVRDTSSLDDVGIIRGTAEIEYGLSRNLSILASTQVTPIDGEEQIFYNAGLRGAFFGTFTRLDVSFQNDNGYAAEVATQFRLGGTSFFAQHTELRNFFSEQFGQSTNQIVRQSEIRLDGAIGGDRLFRLPYSLNVARNQNEDGTESLFASNRLSFNLGQLRASNILNYSTQSGTPDQLGGSALVNTRIFGTSIRTNVNYQAIPAFDFTSVSAIADRRVTDWLALRGSVTQSLEDDNTTSFTLGLNFLLPFASLTTDVAVDGQGGIAAGLSLTTSLGRDPRRGRLHASNRSISRSGAASVRAFLDRDADGRFSQADTPIPGIRFRQHPQETDANGPAFLTGLPANRISSVELDISSLEDPFWEPDTSGFELSPRAGHVNRLDFPIYTTGEIDGIVFLERNGEITETSNVIIQLVDQDGNIAQEARTAFDGFYILERVRPGQYTLRVSPDQIERLQLKEVTPLEIIIGSSEEYAVVSDANFTLRQNLTNEAE